MSGSGRIMIPPLLDQEGRPSHRKRNAALLGLALFIVFIVLLLVR